MRFATIGSASVSGLCIGGNPFSGFSHQTPERSKEMVDWHTPSRIKDVLRHAEEEGINTFFGRTDNHVMDILEEYWDEGGTIQWFAQVCIERGKPDAWRKWLRDSIELGATGTYIHGGVVDNWHANEMWDNFHEALETMLEAGVVAGFAAHNPDAHAWIGENLEADFQMCSYYNPTDRSKSAHHQADGEKWEEEDRAKMLEVIATLPCPVVHYKVFGGGNKPIIEAFETMGKHMREEDVALIGVFLKDNRDMLKEDIALFEEYVDGVGVSA